MPNKSILELPGVKIEEIDNQGGSPLVIKVRFGTKILCPHCKSEEGFRKKSQIKRRVRHNNIGEKAMVLIVRGHKYHCKKCLRYFNQRYPGIMPRKRHSESFRKEIVNQHEKGIPQSILGKWKRIGAATIERWYHDLLDRKDREICYQKCPNGLHGFIRALSILGEALFSQCSHCGRSFPCYSFDQSSLP